MGWELLTPHSELLTHSVGGWVEIRNPKSEVGGRAAIPNSEFRIPNSKLLLPPPVPQIVYAARVFFRLLLLFTVVPLVELYLLIAIGRWVGAVPTIALVIGTGLLGAALARWQGLGVLRRVRDDLDHGRPPTDALIDGLLILIAAAVLLTPGLITDTIGFVLLVPASRAFVRRRVAAAFSRRFTAAQPDVIEAQWRRED